MWLFLLLFSFFSLRNPKFKTLRPVRSKFVIRGTRPQQNALSFESERERGPFSLPKAFGRCRKRRRTGQTLSSRSFRVLVLGFERKRESIQMAGDATQTNPPTNDGAAPLPIVATNATETDGVDRSVHPSGIVPTLQCVFFCSFIVLLCVFSNKRDETMRSSPF